MYIDNPKKLFDDLINIHTMEDYMVAVEEDGMKDDLSNMVSIVYFNKDELWDSQGLGGEGSLRWDLGDFEGMKDEAKLRKGMIADSNALKRIWRILKKELNSKYVLRCKKCGKAYFYSKRPRYSADRYRCPECKSDGAFELVPFEECAPEEIISLRDEYIRKRRL